MLYQSVLLIASAALASAETLNLIVKSDNSEVDGNTLGFPHAGAGLNYCTLGSAGSSQPLEYDESTKTIGEPGSGIPQGLGLSGNFVALTVGDRAEITFDGNTLLFNGDKNFKACKDVNDPYNYSSRSYMLMKFSDDSAPESCIDVTLVKAGDEPAPAPESSPEPAVTTPPAFEGAAANVGPAGAFALAAGVVAAMI